MSLCHFCSFHCIFGRANTFICIIFQLIIIDNDITWFLANIIVVAHIIQMCIVSFFRSFGFPFICFIIFIFLVQTIVTIVGILMHKNEFFVIFYSNYVEVIYLNTYIARVLNNNICTVVWASTSWSTVLLRNQKELKIIISWEQKKKHEEYYLCEPLSRDRLLPGPYFGFVVVRASSRTK